MATYGEALQQKWAQKLGQGGGTNWNQVAAQQQYNSLGMQRERGRAKALAKLEKMMQQLAQEYEAATTYEEMQAVQAKMAGLAAQIKAVKYGKMSSL